jgi:hypothetical protein
MPDKCEFTVWTENRWSRADTEIFLDVGDFRTWKWGVYTLFSRKGIIVTDIWMCAILVVGC